MKGNERAPVRFPKVLKPQKQISTRVKLEFPNTEQQLFHETAFFVKHFARCC